MVAFVSSVTTSPLRMVTVSVAIGSPPGLPAQFVHVMAVQVPEPAEIQLAAFADLVGSPVSATITIKIAEKNFEKIDLFMVGFPCCGWSG